MSTDTRFKATIRKQSLSAKLFAGFTILLIIATLAIAISSLSGRNNQQTMHPGSVSPAGAGALGAIMQDRGVTIEVTDSVSSAIESDSTVLVWDPWGHLTDSERTALLDSGSRIVVISEEGRDADEWLGIYGLTSGMPSSPISPSCSVEWLAGIDTVEGVTSGIRTDGCFPVGSGHHLVVEGNLAYFTSPELFINENLDRRHNAAVAMRALGETNRVTWLMPAPVMIEEQSISVVPTALTGALIGLVLAGLWYGILVRRPFGPLIPEQLPIIVPSAESTRGRARLYERGSNSGHAAAALRAGILAQHSGRLGLPVDASPTLVTARISEASGWDKDRVHHLFYGPPPANDSELINLATSLDTLSKELHNDQPNI